MKKRRGRRSSRSVIIAVIVAALLVIGGIFVYAYYHHQNTANKPANNATVNSPSTDTSLPRQSPTTPSSNSGSSSSTSTQAAPTAPTLNKSSGNGPDHTVPAGVLMNFICNAAIGETCDVLITDTTNPAHVIDLGAKAVASGQYHEPPFASWNWTSVAGNWSIVARATNPGGKSTDSAAQPLKVQ